MTTRTVQETSVTDQNSGQLPPLEPGDRLTAEEFERRYDAMPELKKAELINGVVHIPSPVRLDDHGEPHLDLATWIGTYKIATRGVRGGDNSTARLALANRPQPDLLLLIAPDRGGQARINRDGYVEGGPELVAEVAASSVGIDLHDKFEVYLQNQVREYLVWRVRDRAVDWFVLRGERYERLDPDEAGVIRSEIFPGLWLNVPALVGGNPASVLATLQQGLASPEHAAFVARLNPPPAS